MLKRLVNKYRDGKRGTKVPKEAQLKEAQLKEAQLKEAQLKDSTKLSHHPPPRACQPPERFANL